MTEGAGAREQTASPWKHMLASVSTVEPAVHYTAVYTHLVFLVSLTWVGLKISPRNRKEDDAERDTNCLSHVLRVHWQQVQGPWSKINWAMHSAPGSVRSRQKLQTRRCTTLESNKEIQIFLSWLWTCGPDLMLDEVFNEDIKCSRKHWNGKKDNVAALVHILFLFVFR